MFQNWLNPTTVRTNTDSFSLSSNNSIGAQIDIFEKSMPLLENTQVAIIGLDGISADAIRTEFYQLSHNFPKLRLTDLGNLKKSTSSFVIPVLKELHETNILPILIGGQTSHIYAQYQAHYTKRNLTNLAIVDERVHFELEKEKSEALYLTKILRNRKLFHLGILGCQSHFIPNTTAKYFSKRYFDLLRLGKIRNHMEEVEPILRDADVLAFNLSAIRYADAPAQTNPNPNGLFGEEACQINRYAGMSDKLSSVGFYGFDPAKDTEGQTAQLIAQMLWYFLDGFYHRKQDFPKSTHNLVEYIVDQKELKHQITFWKSTKSGRWWMQVPIKTKKRQERHRLIPCTYSDYQIASQGELPDRLMKAYQRFL